MPPAPPDAVGEPVAAQLLGGVVEVEGSVPVEVQATAAGSAGSAAIAARVGTRSAAFPAGAPAATGAGRRCDGGPAIDRLIAHELEIYGSHGISAADYPALLGLIASGVLRPEKLVSSVIGPDRAGAALAAMDAGTASGLTVIEISEPAR